jgi:hypothetical protein
MKEVTSAAMLALIVVVVILIFKLVDPHPRCFSSLEQIWRGSVLPERQTLKEVARCLRILAGACCLGAARFTTIDDLYQFARKEDWPSIRRDHVHLAAGANHPDRFFCGFGHYNAAVAVSLMI